MPMPQSGSALAPPPIAPDKPWLAPLAGYSDLPFRLLCREGGAAVCVTEMVSAKGYCYRSPGTRELLATSAEDGPLVAQLFGQDPEFIGQTVVELREQGFTYFDLNVGCSVAKVVKTGAGAALLKNPERCVAVVSRMVAEAGEGAVGVKLRLGWSVGEDVFLELAKRLQDAGAAWLALHPRYARQGFSGTADWTKLAELKAAVRLPVIASGDLFRAEDGVACIARTGVDGVMYARGALTDPSIFARHRALVNGETPPERTPGELIDLVRRHAHLARVHGNPFTSLRKMRTFVPRYVKGLPGARRLRVRICQCETWQGLDDLLGEFLAAAGEPAHLTEEGEA